jgi:hypothetical protein
MVQIYVFFDLISVTNSSRNAEALESGIDRYGSIETSQEAYVGMRLELFDVPPLIRFRSPPVWIGLGSGVRTSCVEDGI